MHFPDKLDVLVLHARLLSETGGSPGLRDEGLLESALAAARNRQTYEGADLIGSAATYAYHLTQAQAFVDGNKRIAAAVTETFLETNGSLLELTNSEVVQLFLGIATGRLSRVEVEQVLRSKSQIKRS
jgi:death-on-curing protein